MQPNFKPFPSLIMIGLAFSLFWIPIQGQNDQRGGPEFRKSNNAPFKIKDGPAYTFGYLKVPENRSKQRSAMIQLPVYIFKSRSENPKKDPIIWLTGGPGSSIMQSAKYAEYYRYLDERDLILFEQRGTSYARPHLSCPEWAEAMHEATMNAISAEKKEQDDGQLDSLYLHAAKSCRDRLTRKGIDLDGYNTNEIAADVVDLKTALGLGQINLLAISYGTKIAQVLLRDYPEVVRSAVLDSPLPIEANYDETSIRNLVSTYEQIFADCAADTSCNEAFPDLGDRFFAFLEDITEQPLQIKTYHPQLKKEVVFHLQGKDIGGLLGGFNTAQMVSVPAMIAQILDGDYQVLAEMLQELSPGSGAGAGMRISVWCAEESPFVSRSELMAERQRFKALMGLGSATVRPEVCDVWQVEPAPARENQPVKSAVPVLILSGSYDPITPAAWGRQMLANLENGYQAVFPGYQHGISTYWDNPCGMEMANTFFSDPGRFPDLDCFKKVQIKFITR